MAVNKIVGQEYIIVTIDQVDISNRIAHVHDKTNSPFMASFMRHDAGIEHVPDIGERWAAKKVGNIWHLDQVLDSGAQHLWMAANMGVGDTKIYGNKLWLEVNEIVINDREIGPTVRDFFYSATDGFTSVTLASTPSSYETVQVYLNGVLAEPNIWTLTDQTVTFIPTMAAGHLVVYYQSIVPALDDEGVVKGVAVISGVDLYP